MRILIVSILFSSLAAQANESQCVKFYEKSQNYNLIASRFNRLSSLIGTHISVTEIPRQKLNPELEQALNRYEAANYQYAIKMHELLKDDKVEYERSARQIVARFPESDFAKQHPQFASAQNKSQVLHSNSAIAPPVISIARLEQVEQGIIQSNYEFKMGMIKRLSESKRPEDSEKIKELKQAVQRDFPFSDFSKQSPVGRKVGFLTESLYSLTRRHQLPAFLTFQIPSQGQVTVRVDSFERMEKDLRENAYTEHDTKELEHQIEELEQSMLNLAVLKKNPLPGSTEYLLYQQSRKQIEKYTAAWQNIPATMRSNLLFKMQHAGLITSPTHLKALEEAIDEIRINSALVSEQKQDDLNRPVRGQAESLIQIAERMRSHLGFAFENSSASFKQLLAYSKTPEGKKRSVNDHINSFMKDGNIKDIVDQITATTANYLYLRIGQFARFSNPTKTMSVATKGYYSNGYRHSKSSELFNSFYKSLTKDQVKALEEIYSNSMDENGTTYSQRMSLLKMLIADSVELMLKTALTEASTQEPGESVSLKKAALKIRQDLVDKGSEVPETIEDYVQLSIAKINSSLARKRETVAELKTLMAKFDRKKFEHSIVSEQLEFLYGSGIKRVELQQLKNRLENEIDGIKVSIRYNIEKSGFLEGTSEYEYARLLFSRQHPENPWEFDRRYRQHSDLAKEAIRLDTEISKIYTSFTELGFRLDD
jgi:hypothetical protein